MVTPLPRRSADVLPRRRAGQLRVAASLVLIRSTLSLLLLSDVRANYEEWIVPVGLYDADGPLTTTTTTTSKKDAESPSSQLPPPRFVIGQLNVGEHDEGVVSSRSLRREVRKTTTTTTTKRTSVAAAPRHSFTWDLGNPRDSILLVQDCRACPRETKSGGGGGGRWPGCPSTVPSCPAVRDASCFPSNPDQFLPAGSFRFSETKKGYCSADDHVLAGELDDAVVCMACFDGGDHSRFFSPAVADLDVVGAERTTANQHHDQHHDRHDRSVVVPAFEFGALVRTVPQVDRVWSNVGIGFRSSFLRQLPARSLMLDFDYYGTKSSKASSRIIFNPKPERYASFDATPFTYENRHRHFAVEGVYVGKPRTSKRKKRVAVDDGFYHDFNMDTGNEDVGVHDEELRWRLARETWGAWLDFERDPNEYGTGKALFVPWTRDTAPDATVVFRGGAEVVLPGRVWVRTETTVEKKKKKKAGKHVRLSRTVFTTYGHNVLGLPFLAAPGYTIVFDDEKRMFYTKRVA